ncbi:MAG TPA: hypothetical protein VFN85_07950 [Solirubrobacterales bacterium]|nr:hypothetical protein [Solirubrobacterales bacterium]
MILDLAARTRWKRGRAGERDGSALVSYTEFRPRSLRDMPAIYRASERLRDEGVRLEGAIGIVTYWQPFRRCVGSLSFWTGEDALRRFVSLPFHVEIMRAYRDRGRLRAVSWRTDDLRLRPAFARGRRALSEGMGRQGQR